jgi:hypothetical protein
MGLDPVYQSFFFFVDWVPAVLPHIFARCLSFRNQLSLFFQIKQNLPSRSRKMGEAPISVVGNGLPGVWDQTRALPSRSLRIRPPGHTGGLLSEYYSGSCRNSMFEEKMEAEQKDFNDF